MATGHSVEFSYTNIAGNTILCIPARRFTSGGYKSPSPITYPEISYTVRGVPVMRGVQHEPRLQWSFEALLTEEESNRLRGLFYRSDKARREYGFPGISMSDKMALWTEDPPRSRLVADGETVVTTADGRLEYYGVFSVAIANLEITRPDYYFHCAFDCLELFPTGYP